MILKKGENKNQNHYQLGIYTDWALMCWIGDCWNYITNTADYAFFSPSSILLCERLR